MSLAFGQTAYLFIAATYRRVFNREDYCFDYRQYFFTKLSILVLFGIGFDYCLCTTLVSYRICLPLQLYWRIGIFNLGLYIISFVASTMPQPSYRRNRDYTNDFNWTYELKTDVHKCYVEAHNDKSIEYMKRLNNLWDKMHPEYNFLSDKNLRDQASRVRKNNVIMGTQYRETSTSITRHDNRFTVTDNENNYENIVPNKNIIPDEVTDEDIPNENLNYKHLQLVEKLDLIITLKRLNYKQYKNDYIQLKVIRKYQLTT